MNQERGPGRDPLKKVAVGIDLGTTNSAVAFMDPQEVLRLVPIHGHYLTPSVVCDHAPFLTGRSAVASGRPCFFSSKRHMGGPAPAQHPLSPVQAAAHILRYLREGAEVQLGASIEEAVITVPAYFSESARAATRDAAAAAGLSLRRLLNEPTAAALAYGLEEKEEGTYAVYDLGGGTFDISVLNMRMGVFHILAVGGDPQLGGDDIDSLLAAHFGIQSPSPNERQHMRAIKEFLSDNPHWEGVISERSCSLSREDFENLVRPVVEKTLAILKHTLNEAGVSQVSSLKEIILVGGSVRMPLIKRLVEDFVGKPPLCSLDPEAVVALGAGLQASRLSTGSGALVLEVSPLSLGLETLGGSVEKIIFRNTSLPIRVSQEFTTSCNNQDSLKIHVVQGESSQVGSCRSLGHFILKDLSAAPAGALRIDVTFSLDVDGLLSVTAQERGSDQVKTLEIKPSYGLTEPQVLEMIKLGKEAK